MLQEMRKYAQSWVASLFMGALALSFALWGIADIFRGNADTTVYSIGSTQISSDLFAREFHNVIRNAGTTLTPDQTKIAGQQILDRMMSGTALDMIAAKLGLTATDDRVRAQIQGMQAFNGALGTFDHATFVQVIGRAGYNEAEFVAAIRKDIARDQLLRSIEGGYLMPPDYARAIYSYVNESRAAEYIVLTPAMVGSIAPPADDVLATYIKAHPDRFSTPEYRSVSYAALSIDEIAPTIPVTDKQIDDELAANRSDYVVPEKREVEQIGFKTEDAAKAAKSELDSGKSFDALATEQKLKPAEYKLGQLSRDDLAIDPARAAATFALSEGGVSAPVKGTFGWVLIHVAKIVPGSSKSHDEIKLAVQRKLAVAKMTDIANAFTDAVGGGDTVEQAARKSGMHFARIAAVDMQGLAPDGSKTVAATSPELLSNVFKSEVGDEGDPFPTADGHFYAIKVDGVTPPKLKPLDAVRTQAIAQWTAEQQVARLKAKASALVARAALAHSLDVVAKELGVPVQASPALTRRSDNPVFNAALTASLFDAAPGATVSGPTSDGSYVIARVTGIHHPALPADRLEYLKGVRELSTEISSDFSSTLAKAEEAHEGVNINQKLVDSTVGNSGSGS